MLSRNGVAAAACLAAALAACGGERGPAGGAPRARNLVLISIDTLRADHLSCYGYGRATSPHLDAFAAGGHLFEDAVAESPWTIPSHVTLLSGLHPLRHGVRLPDQVPDGSVALLAETLRAAGFFTVGLTGGGWLSEAWGFDRGFDFFEGTRGQEFATTLARAQELLRFRRARGPFFAFLHTYDVHCPYDPPEPFLSRFRDPAAEPFDARGKCGNPDLNAMRRTPGNDRHLVDRYDGGIAWVDEALGGFFRFLEDEGFLEDTLVILVADHGEELGEHGQIGHERTLRSEALRIPWIARGPGVAPGRSAEAVGLCDVVPTALALLGLSVPAGLDGRSLAGALSGGAPEAGAPTLSDLAWQEDLVAVTSPEGQVILDRATGEARRFGPGEPEEGSPAGPEVAAELRARAAALSRAAHVPLPLELPASRRAELEALGYVAGER